MLSSTTQHRMLSRILGSYQAYLRWLENRFVFSHACLHTTSYHSFQLISAALLCLMRKDNQQNKLGVLCLTSVFVTQGNPNEETNTILPRETFSTISITVLIGRVWLPDYPLISTRMLFGKKLKYALHGSHLHLFSTFSSEQLLSVYWDHISVKQAAPERP